MVLLALALTDLAIVLNVPGLRQVLGFLLLAFWPGLAVLQMLRLNKLSAVETILYSVGLSLAFIMLLGFGMNLAYPAMGIPRPISTAPVTIMVTVLTGLMMTVGYLTNKDFSIRFRLAAREALSWQVLILALLVGMAFLGMEVVKSYDNNTLLFLVVILIVLIVILTASGRVPVRYYPMVIFAIAIALEMRGALKTFYIAGDYGDMAFEFYYYSLVAANSSWDSTHPSTVNAMLATTIMPAMFSNLLNVAGEWIFRLVYPLIFALVPVGLFQAWREQTSEKTAFLAAFFLMSTVVFFESLPLVPRQEVAEFFLVLSVLVLVQSKMGSIRSKLLLIVFLFGIVVSHYATSYLYLFYILMAWLVIGPGRRLVMKLFGNQVKKLPTLAARMASQSQITGDYAALNFSLALSWYIYNASAIIFDVAVRSADHVYRSLATDFFNPLAREHEVLLAVGLAAPPPSVWYKIYTYLTYATELFIVVGVFYILVNALRKKDFKNEYIALLLISSALLAMFVLLPNFAQKLSIGRFYHLVLLLVAVCCPIGGQTVLGWMGRLLQKALRPLGRPRLESLPPVMLVAILIAYFLFNTHVIQYFTMGSREYTALTMPGYKTSPNINERIVYLLQYVPEKDFASARWLSERKDPGPRIYADYTGFKNLLKPYPFGPEQAMEVLTAGNLQAEESTAFVLLRGINVKENIVVTGKIGAGGPSRFNYTDLGDVDRMLEGQNKVYSNRTSEVFQFTRS